MGPQGQQLPGAKNVWGPKFFLDGNYKKTDQWISTKIGMEVHLTTSNSRVTMALQGPKLRGSECLGAQRIFIEKVSYKIFPLAKGPQAMEDPKCRGPGTKTEGVQSAWGLKENFVQKMLPTFFLIFLRDLLMD